MGKNIVLIAKHELPANVCKTRILIIKSLPPLSTSIDLVNIHRIELRSADGRLIGSYWKE